MMTPSVHFRTIDGQILPIPCRFYRAHPYFSPRPPCASAPNSRRLAATRRRPSPRVQRILLGELSSEALSSIRAVPKVLLDKGFTYQYPELREALRKALEKR